MRHNPLAGLALLLASAALWGALGTPPIVTAPFAWLAALWLPGMAFLGRTRSGDNPLERALLALGAGPVLFGVFVCLLRLVGIPLASAALAIILLSALTVVATPPSAPLGFPRGRAVWTVLVAGLAVVVLGAYPSLTHEPLRLRDDALLHLPVMQRVLAGEFPPGNPFLTGEPLAYFWFYHVVLGGVARLTHLPLDWIPAGFNVQALILLLAAVDRTARRFGAGTTARVFALLLLAVGLSPWGWMRQAYYQWTRPDLNWALIETRGAHAILPLLSPQEPRLAAFLTKVAISNALPASLGLMLLAAVPPRISTLGAWLQRTVWISGCLLFHMATGALLAAGLALQWILARWVSSGTTGSSRKALAALLLSSLVVLPYLLTVMGARETGSATVAFQPLRALELNIPLLVIWVLALLGARRWIGQDASRDYLLVGIPAFALPWLVHLVDGNEYKGIFFLFVLLLPAAGAGLARIPGRIPWVGLLVIALALPTAWTATRVLARDVPPESLDPFSRTELSNLARSLPQNGVIWSPDPGRAYSPFTFPLGRPSYLSDPYALQILGQWGGTEARWRRGSLEAVRGTDPLSALAAASSRLPGRPLLVALTPSDRRRWPGLERRLIRLGAPQLLSHPALRVYGPPPAP